MRRIQHARACSQNKEKGGNAFRMETATGISRKLDTMRLKYQYVILILRKKRERILRPRGACKPAAYGAI